MRKCPQFFTDSDYRTFGDTYKTGISGSFKCLFHNDYPRLAKCVFEQDQHDQIPNCSAS